MPRREEVARDIRRMTLGAHPLDYVLVRRRGRRGVGFKVDENGLTVSAPVSLAVARIESLVRDSEAWILRKIGENKPDQLGDITTLADPGVVKNLVDERLIK